MKEVLVSLPTALSGGMRLYAAYLIIGETPNLTLVSGAFLLTLSVYAIDRLEDYDGSPVTSALFTVRERPCT